jgi:adenylate cyclase
VPRPFAFWAGLVLLALLLAHASGHLRLAALDALDGGLHDLRVRLWPAAAVNPRITIVELDEAALAEVGRWPWPRETVAELVERLFEREGALVVGLDIILSEQGGAAGDARLARVMAAHPVVLGLYLNAAAGAPRRGALPAPLATGAPAALPPWQGHIGPLPELHAAAAGTGFLNAMIDRDGITRRAPIVAGYDGALRAAFALALARVVAGDAVLRAVARADGAGQVLVPFPAETGRVPRVSAADVMAGRTRPDALRGHVVLVGSAAAGLGDVHIAPTGVLTPGVELHANLLAGLLGDSLPAIPAATPALTVLQLLLAGGLLMVGLPRLGALAGAALVCTLALALVAVNSAAWAWGGYALPLAPLLVLLALLWALQLFFGQLGEALARRRLAALFGQYVPPELVEQMARDPERYTMEGRSAELTVLFSDVRGFTTFSEQLAPPELAALMNRYFSVMTEIVRRHRGTLDKYVGDALMAFWGAPLEDPAHAMHAVQAALAMQAALADLNREFAQHGWPPIRITIGINTGTMVVGDMGSRDRRAYTVLGDAVNVAARLQELSGKLECPVVIGEATAKALPAQWRCRALDQVTLRGRSAPLAIFQPLGP